MEPLTKGLVTRFDDDTFQWFVLRDLKRSNAKMPAYPDFVNAPPQLKKVF